MEIDGAPGARAPQVEIALGNVCSSPVEPLNPYPNRAAFNPIVGHD